ncbi:MAG TPA: hypothetical protein PLG94_14360 [Smithellaceae bacterium]|nr:hypothetical protein [Smithellaceae bacterium]
MKEEDIKKYKHSISKLNEIRRKYWSELRSLRNDLIVRYRDKPVGPVNIIDPDAKELLQTLDDMWESCAMEDMRRSSKTPRSKTIPLCPLCSAPLKDFIPKKKDGAGGLYTSDEKCMVCGLPLSGRHKKYCSDVCRINDKSRRWRQKNPDDKARANKKYLNKYYK